MSAQPMLSEKAIRSARGVVGVVAERIHFDAVRKSTVFKKNRDIILLLAMAKQTGAHAVVFGTHINKPKSGVVGMAVRDRCYLDAAIQTTFERMTELGAKNSAWLVLAHGELADAANSVLATLAHTEGTA